MGILSEIGLFVLITSLLLNVIFFVRYQWTKKSRLRSFFINFSISGFTLLYLFVIAEFFFFFLHIQSDGFGFTLASQKWFAKYWNPINSFGYRDIERTKAQLSGKNIVYVVGDSFVAGHGIKNSKDRFSNVLENKLGKEWVAINMAENGWGTEDEYKAIVSYPYRPNIIILSYFINDIQGAARKNGLEPESINNHPPRILAPFINKSHMFNFLYWRSYRIMGITSSYIEFLLLAFSNEDVWQIHKSELLEIIHYANDLNIKLVVVVFPFLNNFEESKIATSKIISLMDCNKVTVVDLTTILARRNFRDLIVNSSDVHPNVELHHEIADLLYKEIDKINNNPGDGEKENSQ